jgi:hypothetical protein
MVFLIWDNAHFVSRRMMRLLIIYWCLASLQGIFCTLFKDKWVYTLLHLNLWN